MECNNDINVMMNQADWNEWMDVLARCSVVRERDALRQIEKLNGEFRRICSGQGLPEGGAR